MKGGDFWLKLAVNIVAFSGMAAVFALIAYAFWNASFVSGEWTL